MIKRRENDSQSNRKNTWELMEGDPKEEMDLYPPSLVWIFIL